MGPGQWTRSVAVAAAVGSAVAVYATSENLLLQNVAYLGVMVGASISAWIGAERAPHARRTVPRLIAAGVTLTALGDVLWSVLDAVGASTDVSVADGPWFASYVVLGVALWSLLRRHGAPGRRDGDFLVDAATIVAVSVITFWSLSIETIVADDSVAPTVRAVWAAYPVADAVLLALVVRVMMSKGSRGALGREFALGVCFWLAADVAYLEAPSHGTAVLMMDSAWLVAVVLLAGAAWRSEGMAHDDAPTTGRDGVVPLLLAIGPLCVPPVLEVVRDLRGQPDQPVTLLVSSLVLIALAFVRTSRLLRSEERAHHALEQARDQALDASRAKTVFVANISHELRTPLTTVLATAEMLDDTPLDETQRRLLERMERAGGKLASLVEEVLDYSRIEAGEVTVERRPFDLHDLLAEIVDAQEVRRLRPGPAFEWHLDPATPREALGDPARTFQVVDNLLDNAQKFTAHGAVRLEVAPSATVAHGIDFVVSDTGIGIRPEHLSSIFESFNQVDGSVTRRYEGSGLGLAICRRLTRLMGGSISVQSAEGEGSTFTVTLPLLAQVAADPPTPQRRVPQGAP